jgi:hypothetical protein
MFVLPNEASALVSIFRSHSEPNELMATLAIDPDPIFLAPVRESIRVDVDALDDLPGLNGFLFHFLGTLEPLFPSARHFVAVLGNASDGGVIFFCKPANSNRPEARVIESRIIKGAHSSP